MDEYDLVVIGSGPAGIHASVQAAKLGKRVCVIEAVHEKVGGSWIHTGTLPSKTLRETMATIHSIKHHAGSHWVERIVDDLHTGKLFQRARDVSEQEEMYVKKYLEKNGIDVIKGRGRLQSFEEVVISTDGATTQIVHGKNILVATGSKPRRPDNVPFDGWRIIDADDVLNLEQVPRSMVVLGAGVIGSEYACIFAALGVKLTFIDTRDTYMPFLDQEIAGALKHSMEDDLGVTFIHGKKVDKIWAEGPKCFYEIDGETKETDVFFYCEGRSPQSEGLGLEEIGVKLNQRGFIEVDKDFETNIKGVYAAGDIIGPPGLAATSSEQGRHVSCHAFHATVGSFPTVYPYGVYTIPEMSMAGKTEEQLKEEGANYVVGRAYYSEIARGHIRGDEKGRFKLLVDKDTHKILGIHILGGDAANLVHIALAFMVKDGTVHDLIEMIFNYPTLAEGYRIAAFNALNKIFPSGVFKQVS